MRDLRTPSNYWEQHQRVKAALTSANGKLDDLIAFLQEQTGNKPKKSDAYKKCANLELARALRRKEKQRRVAATGDIVDKIIAGDLPQASELMREEIDARVFSRIEPAMIEAGREMENHIFNGAK